MLKVGLIGNGGISNQHKKAYAQIAEEGGAAIVEAYCDVNPDNLKGLEGRLYTNIDEMLEKEQGRLDYVDLCLPTFLHMEVAIKAMERGFHVLCEKPMALDPEQCEKMLAASRRTGKTLMIAHCNRFMPAVELIRETIASGELGKVRNAEFRRDSGGPTPGSWLRRGTLSGGALVDTHVHDVDLIRHLFGMPKAVSATGMSVLTDGGYDIASVHYLYKDEMFVHATCNWALPNNKFNSRAIRVNFEKGYIFCDRTPGREAFFKVTEDGAVTDLTEKLDFSFFYKEIVYFIDCIANSKPVEKCLPEEASDAIRVIMAELKSMEQNCEKITV